MTVHVVLLATDRGVVPCGVLRSFVVERVARLLPTAPHVLVISGSDAAEATFHRTLKSVAQRVAEFAKTCCSAGSMTPSPEDCAVIIALPDMSHRDSRRACIARLASLLTEEHAVVVLGYHLRLVANHHTALRLSFALGVELANAVLLGASGDPASRTQTAKRVLEQCPAADADAFSCSDEPGLDVYHVDAAVTAEAWVAAQRAALCAPISRRTAVLFVGAHEVFESHSGSQAGYGPFASKTSHQAPELSLSLLGRRMICEWCTAPSRYVCFVALGSHRSGQRYSAAALVSWLTSTTVLSAVSSAGIFATLEVDGDAPGFLPSPLPLSATSLGFLVHSLNVDVALSLVVGDLRSCDVSWISGACPELECCDVYDSDMLGHVLEAKRRQSRGTAAPEVLSEDKANTAVREVEPTVAALPLGVKQQAAFVQRRLLGAVATTSYVCDLNSLQNVSDEQTTSVARRYVQEKYLKTDESLSMRRIGEATLLATSVCASSDRRQEYRVEIGITSGAVMFSSCECRSITATRFVCRHAAALCLVLMGVRLETVPLDSECEEEDVRCHNGGSLPLLDDNASQLPSASAVAEQCSEKKRPVFTYTPVAVCVTESGLPVHMMETKKSKRNLVNAETRTQTARTSATRAAHLFGPNAPSRRRMTPFFFFSSRMRAGLKEREPLLKPTEVARRLGEMWKALSEAERSEVANECARDGDDADAEWAAYRETEEYKQLMAERRCADDQKRPSSKRPEPLLAAEPEDKMGIDEEEGFAGMHPEWRQDANGKWICEWDSSEESLCAAEVATPERKPKLGSVAVRYFETPHTTSSRCASSVNDLHRMRRGLSEAETKASLEKLAERELH